MLVYGDVENVETVGAKLAAIEAALTRASRLPPGIERHAALVTAFIETGELVQGLIDAEFHDRGFDTRSALHASDMECLFLLARSVHQSWQGGLATDFPPASLLENLLRLDPARPIRTRRAEGYAFYALYPESYLEAAACSGLGQNTRVIGIRSIGTGLGALVAAAIDAPPPFTVRPVGHPFHREVRVDPTVTEELVADSEAAFAVVDEGPGLSGSSFGAVADWLEAAGVARERIHFFPSHNGALGPQASDNHRERWKQAARHVIGMERLLLHSAPPNNLTGWIEEVLGPLEEPLEEISGGTWRTKHYRDEVLWPAANIQHERRKFLAQANGSSWLVKFVGLGAIGERKYRQAKQLSEAGFTPEVAGYRHGFLVERWHQDARPLDQAGIDRKRLVERVGSYLAFRARHFPAEGAQGASLNELRHMACYNTQQALGEAEAAKLERSLPSAANLEGKVRPVFTDNRMHAWEWITIGPRLLKTDALDHSMTHDLVGPQDISWDIAGAVVELDLSADEASYLCDIVRRESGHPVSNEFLAFMRPCYLAFQLGAHVMAAHALGDGEETVRLRRAAERYASRLQGADSSAAQLVHRPREQEEAPAG